MRLMNRRRSALSTAFVAYVIVVVLIAAFVAYYFTLQPSVTSSSASSTPLGTTSTKVSSSPTSTASTISTTTTTSSAPAAASFDFGLSAAPGNIVLSPGTGLFYPALNIAPASTSVTSGESVSLEGTLPTGITVSFDSNPVKINPGVTRSVAMTFNVGQGVSPGDYKVTIAGKSGSFSESTTFTIHVVQYLILEQANTYVPSTLSVKAGSTVYWINMDAPAGGDPEIHNIVFTSGATTTSPDMHQYDVYSYTFTAAGTYSYYCAYHPASMKATITVSG